MNKIIILIMGIFVLVGLVYASGVVFFGVNESGLVGEWHFDGNTDDSSGNENDGTLLSSSVSLDNNITYTTDSKGGSHALNFPGTIVSLNQLNGDDDLPFGQSTNYQKIAQSFVAPSTGLVRSVGARRGTDGGDPTGSVYFDIANDDGGEPGTAITTEGYSDANFNIFSTTAERFHHMYTTLTPGITYWLIYRMSTTDDSNSRNIKYDSGGSYGTLKEFNGTHWNTIPGTLRFNLRYNDDLVFDSNVVLPYNDFTVSWWMKRNDKVYENIFCRGRNAANGRISINTDGRIRFESYTNNVFQPIMTTGVDDLNWHYYTLVSSADNFQLYVDGVNTYSFGSANTDTVDQIYRYIGVQNYQMPSTYGIGLNAILDEVKIYNQALSADEITQLYNDKPKLKVSSLQKGLVGHWALDSDGYNSNTERITDKTPYENHGTNNGTILTTDRMGQSNRALEFDGVDDYVALGTNLINFTEPFTVSLWLKATGSGTSGQNVFEVSHTRGIRIQYDQISTGRIEVFLGDGTSDNRIESTDITPNIWGFVTVVYDGTTSYLYMDGDQKDSEAVNISDSDNLYYLGRYSGYSGVEDFNGSISDVRIYNRALSADEIDTLYHSYRPKAASGSLQKGLVLDMPLKSKYTKDETVGSEIMTDRTPYSNDGQNYGAVVGSDYTDFDGVDDRVTLSVLPTITAPYSVSLWFYPRELGRWQTMVSLIGGQGYPYFNFHGNNRLLMYTPKRRYSTKVFEAGDLNKWWHVVFIVRGVEPLSDWKVYLNGVDNSGTAVDDTYNEPGTYGTIGVRGVTGYPFNGSISDVRIYNRALSASEIKLLYDKGR